MKTFLIPGSVVLLLLLSPLARAQQNPQQQQQQQRQQQGNRPIIVQGTLKEGKRTVKLAELRGKPVVLIFGSCTCPPFVASTQQTSQLYERYKERVHFFLV